MNQVGVEYKGSKIEVLVNARFLLLEREYNLVEISVVFVCSHVSSQTDSK